MKNLTQNFSKFVGNIKFLAQYNGLNLDNFIDGIIEIKFYNDGEFEKLNNSTSAKVGIIHNLLQRYVDGNIQIPSMEYYVIFRFKKNFFNIHITWNISHIF